MKTRCPDCGREFTIHYYPERDQTTWCPECRTFFSTEEHLIAESKVSSQDETFAVEWQMPS